MKKKPAPPEAPVSPVVEEPATPVEYDPPASYGGMQVLKKYKAALDPRFLAYYAKEFVNERMMYTHWTAGRRDQNFTDYHRVVTANARGVSVVHNNAPMSQDLPAHTYGRNHNSMAVCLAGLLGATTNDLGAHVPGKTQINALVDTVTAVCLNYRVPVANIMSHAEAADNVDQANGLTPGLRGEDALPYGPAHTCERWDLHCFIHTETLKMLPPTSTQPPAGTEKFMDWLRGQVILNLQAHTRKYWKGT